MTTEPKPVPPPPEITSVGFTVEIDPFAVTISLGGFTILYDDDDHQNVYCFGSDDGDGRYRDLTNDERRERALEKVARGLVYVLKQPAVIDANT